MSTLLAPPRREVAPPPRQTPLRSFESYSEAERRVELLAKRCFPVEYVSIVARGIVTVERTRSKRWPDWRWALPSGIGGALVGALVVLFSPSVAVAAVVGAITAGVACDRVWRRALERRDFRCLNRVDARAYDLLVQSEWAYDAEQVLTAGTRPRTDA